MNMLKRIYLVLLLIGLSASYVHADTVSYQDHQVRATTPQYSLFDTTTNSEVSWWNHTFSNGITQFSALTNKPAGAGNALNFDGDPEHVVMSGSDGTALDITGDKVTIALWVWADSWGSLTQLAGNRDGNSGYMLRPDSNNATFYIYNGSFVNANAGAISTGGWHFFVGTYDGANILAYLDNVASTPTATTGNIVSGDNFFLASNVGANQFFNGKLDEIAVWDRALTSSEISDLWNSGAGLKIDPSSIFPSTLTSMGDNLVGLWHMDEASGINVSDSSTVGNDGTTQNMEDNDWVSGKVLNIGVDNKINVIKAKDGLDATQGYIIEIGDSTNPGEIIYIGDEQAWKLDGTTVMYLDRDTKTLVIDTGEATSESLKLIGAASQSEYLLALQDSSLTDSFLLGVAGGKLAANADGEITLFEDVGSSDNATAIFKQFGYITAASGAKYIQWHVNDTSDWFELTREDSNILGLDTQVPFRAGDGTNYLDVQSDGEVKLVGTARVKQHIHLPLSAFSPGAASPTATTIGHYPGYSFSHTVTQSASAVIHVPVDWDSSTDMLVHVHWAPTDGNAGDVVWDVDYKSTAAEANEVLTGTQRNLSVTDSTQSLQDEHLKTADMTIPAGDLADLDMIGITLSRDTGDAADTYGTAAFAVFLELIYTSNKLGEAT